MDCVVTWCVVLAVVVDIFGGYLWSNCHYDVFKTVFNYDVHRNFSGGCPKSSEIPHCSSLLVWYIYTWRKHYENFVIKMLYIFLFIYFIFWVPYIEPILVSREVYPFLCTWLVFMIYLVVPIWMLVKQVRHDPLHPKLSSLIVENLPVFDHNNH
jgi:hypothetical protein